MTFPDTGQRDALRGHSGTLAQASVLRSEKTNSEAYPGLL
jgi:hypothetical protein